MVTILLVIIYISFISLGLPDSVLGSAWPIMHTTINVPLSSAGVISMIISFGTIVSSLLSSRLIIKLGTGLVTALSTFLTALALLGFSFAGSFAHLCLLAIPYGLGAGAVDAALNNYVALHYNARHMSFLHCFWGVGCSAGPIVMAYFLTRGDNWRGGYLALAIFQLILTAFLFITLTFWKRAFSSGAQSTEETKENILSLKEVIALPGARAILIAFFAYCALEHTTGLWASSYLVEVRGIDAYTAARFASLYYLGITFGRFLSGLITMYLGDRKLIRYGACIMGLGALMILLPLGIRVLPLAGLVILGLGSAPIYPSIIHCTPENFGKENSQSVIGVQMASAYVGSTFMPPVFGFLSAHLSLSIFPLYMVFFIVLLLCMTEYQRSIHQKNLSNN